jgi:hypothetical protein
MASLTTWLVRLGNAGAVRNAAAVCAERRASEMQADAMMRRFDSEHAFNKRAASGERGSIAFPASLQRPA